MSNRDTSRAGRALIGLTLLGAVAVTVLPILWMITSALQRPRALVRPGWSFEFSFQNFGQAFQPGSVYFSQLLNSLVLVFFATLICVSIGAVAGYSLSQLKWHPRTVLRVLILAGVLQLVPPMTLVPGLFVVLENLGLRGTLSGLVVLNVVFNLPFALIMCKFYFDTLSGELREAAAVDGASDFVAFRKVMLPLAMPGVAAVTIFIAIQVWNEFLFGLVFTTGGSSSPITVGIATLIQPQAINYAGMAAVGTVTAMPIIVLALAANRQIVIGLTAGGVKG